MTVQSYTINSTRNNLHHEERRQNCVPGEQKRFFVSLRDTFRRNFIDCISQKGPLSNDSSSCQGRGDNSIIYMFSKFPKSKSGFHMHQPRQNLEYLYRYMTTESCDPKMHWFSTKVTLPLIIMEVEKILILYIER